MLPPAVRNFLKKFSFLAVLGTVLVAAVTIGVVFLRSDLTLSKTPVSEPSESLRLEISETIMVRFFQPELFFPAVQKVRDPEPLFEPPLQVGVVPHHLIASDKIAAFFAAASSEQRQTVILIGPDHAERGESEITTTRADWSTPLGRVTTDQVLTARMLELPFVSEDHEVSAAEHSVSGLLPFVREYFPTAQVVTLLVSRDATVEQLHALAATLASPPAQPPRTPPTPPPKVLLIASVDFSHGVYFSTARQQDAHTLKLLQNQQYDTLQQLKPTHVDSPGSLILADSFARLQNTSEIERYDWGTAAEYTKKPYEDITSYLVLGWK